MKHSLTGNTTIVGGAKVVEFLTTGGTSISCIEESNVLEPSRWAHWRKVLGHAQRSAPRGTRCGCRRDKVLLCD